MGVVGCTSAKKSGRKYMKVLFKLVYLVMLKGDVTSNP